MITITIKTDNSAFEENAGAEIARILRDIADDFSRNGYAEENYRDINGNKVCTVK
jgi:hypothetical protein